MERSSTLRGDLSSIQAATAAKANAGVYKGKQLSVSARIQKKVVSFFRGIASKFKAVFHRKAEMHVSPSVPRRQSSTVARATPGVADQERLAAIAAVRQRKISAGSASLQLKQPVQPVQSVPVEAAPTEPVPVVPESQCERPAETPRPSPNPSPDIAARAAQLQQMLHGNAAARDLSLASSLVAQVDAGQPVPVAAAPTEPVLVAPEPQCDQRAAETPHPRPNPGLDIAARAAQLQQMLHGGYTPRNMQPESSRIALTDAEELEKPARPLKEAVGGWYLHGAPPPKVADGLRGLEETMKTKELSKFLDGLNESKSAKRMGFILSVRELLAQVFDSPALLTETLEAAFLASSRCADRVSLTFNEMMQLAHNDRIRNGEFSTRETIAELRRSFRSESLQKIMSIIVEEKVQAKLVKQSPVQLAQLGATDFDRKMALREGMEEVEVFFGMQGRLQADLNLHLGEARNNFGSGLVDETNTARAKKHVMEAENKEFAEWFTNSYQWEGVLQRNYTALYEHFIAQSYKELETAMEKHEAGVGDAPSINGIRAKYNALLTREVLAMEGLSGALDPVWK